MKPKGAPTSPADQWGHSPNSFGRPIFQLAGERGRLVVAGLRTDNEEPCELLVVADVGGSVALYPHGAAKFGVRVSEEDAAIVGRALLGEGDTPREASGGR